MKKIIIIFLSLVLSFSAQANDAKSYAGFFHTSYSGMAKRNVMGMNGYGGQAIVIDFDKGRIIVVNSITEDYSWKNLVHSVIKKGK